MKVLNLRILNFPYCFLLLCVVTIFSTITNAYVYTDSYGTPTMVTDPTTPPGPSKNSNYLKLVARAAVEVVIDPALLEAVITRESGWHSHAISSKGALGLMQLMPATAQNWGVKDPFDPWQNILGGAKHLKYLTVLFDKNIPLALAAYHAGENRTLKEGQIPSIKETQNYVRAVLDTYWDLTERKIRP